MTRRDSGFDLRWTEGARLAEAVETSLCALDRLELPSRHRHRLAVIIEELLANQWDHGAAGEAALIVLRVERGEDHLLLVLEDAAAAFDPRSSALDSPIPDRGGGAGLALVRAWSDSLDYRPGPPINRLELRYGLTD